ncbi:hypothetical protein TVAG_031830 [Trichomonas vaginalis G3]|uniref:Uncharacterized protein n=1 Tax=Trichomonas vaginalis (strain ATCC PRA-98 / G3) TaxID=412133 RepID=A2EUI2_TRIV3|nr:hypothetical protein TVAGG3_0363380 [Trichomonas vaginalis G3]EAY03684.1 hypothetical protein TVAG_031830 [Trichomonas vaginalis G3]KAI5532098.1 hypothetical protein TVAGG3_0363380 [Trichomonas vaginalis G3]|eukprot:XP_001315907.1 hypothetical protein [Trichomonas vaginalis G3]
MEENDIDQVITHGLLNISFDYSNVREILSELNKRIEHLRNDSQRAKEIKEFNDAIVDMKAQLVSCNGRIGEVERNVNFIQATNQRTLNQMTDKFNNLYELTQTNIDKKQVELITAAQQQIDTGLINGITKMRKKFTDSFSTIDMHNELAYKLDQLSDKFEKMSTVSTDGSFDESKLQTILERLGVLETNMDAAQQTISENSDNVLNMKSQMDSLQTTTDEVQEIVISSRSAETLTPAIDNEALKSQMQGFEDRIAELQKEIENVRNTDCAKLQQDFTSMQEGLADTLNDIFAKIEIAMNNSAGRISAIERSYSKNHIETSNQSTGSQTDAVLHINTITTPIVSSRSSMSSASVTTPTPGSNTASPHRPAAVINTNPENEESEISPKPDNDVSERLENNRSLSMLLPDDVEPSQIIDDDKTPFVPGLLGLDKVQRQSFSMDNEKESSNRNYDRSTSEESFTTNDGTRRRRRLSRTMSSAGIIDQSMDPTQSRGNLKPIIVEGGARELSEKLQDLVVRVEEIEHQLSKTRRSERNLENLNGSQSSFDGINSDAIQAINKRIDHCCSRETVDKVLQIVKNAVSKLGTRVENIEKDNSSCIHKDEFVKYLNAVQAATEGDNTTAAATRGYKCLLCGREKGGVVGMITDSEIARLMGEPQSCAPVRAGDTVILNYGSGPVRPKSAINATKKSTSKNATKLPKIEDKV